MKLSSFYSRSEILLQNCWFCTSKWAFKMTNFFLLCYVTYRQLTENISEIFFTFSICTMVSPVHIIDIRTGRNGAREIRLIASLDEVLL